MSLNNVLFDLTKKLSIQILLVAHLWGRAHVAIIPSGPVDVAAFSTLPVVSRKKPVTFFGRLLSDFMANFLRSVYKNL